jgi:hypothetical protein
MAQPTAIRSSSNPAHQASLLLACIIPSFTETKGQTSIYSQSLDTANDNVNTCILLCSSSIKDNSTLKNKIKASYTATVLPLELGPKALQTTTSATVAVHSVFAL